MGKAGKLRIILAEPNRKAVISYIDCAYKAMQDIVGGRLETFGLNNELYIVCNADGKARGLPENRFGVYGTFFMCRSNADGKFASVKKRDIEIINGEGEK